MNVKHLLAVSGMSCAKIDLCAVSVSRKCLLNSAIHVAILLVRNPKQLKLLPLHQSHPSSQLQYLPYLVEKESQKAFLTSE